MRATLAAILLTTFCSCFADLKFHMLTKQMRGENRERIVYVHDDRIRTELPDTGRVNIRQCDLNRLVQLDTGAKTYRILPLMPRANVHPEETVSGSCRMTTRRVLEETGEAEQFLGVQAQHIRVFVYMEPVPESCPNNPRLASTLVQQRDGWYVEIPPLPECPARSEGGPPLQRSFDAADHYLRTDGTTTPELLPAKVEVKVRHGRELRTDATTEVSEFSTKPLDPALFEIPPDYHQDAAPDCSNHDPIVTNLDDGTPVYRPGCGVTPPRVVYQTEPEFTEHARKKNISGTVVVSLVVDTNGSVRDVKVERALEPSLDQQALAAVRTWKFEPAMKNGQPVMVQLNAEVTFKLYVGSKHH